MRRATPNRIAELSDRDRLLWQRFFARRGVRFEDVTEFTISRFDVPEGRVVRAETIDRARSGRFLMIDDHVFRVRWHEVPLARRTYQTLPELDA